MGTIFFSINKRLFVNGTIISVTAFFILIFTGVAKGNSESNEVALTNLVGGYLEKGDVRGAKFELRRLLNKQLQHYAHKIFFEFNSTQLQERSFKVLDVVSTVLKKYPNVGVIIEGHTDNIGSKQYNLNLSTERAKVINAYLVTSGISTSRISSYGYGETRPIATNKTEKGRAHNRRVEIITDYIDDEKIKYELITIWLKKANEIANRGEVAKALNMAYEMIKYSPKSGRPELFLNRLKATNMDIKEKLIKYIHEGDNSGVKKCLEQVGDSKFFNDKYFNPLMIAAKEGKTDIAKILLEYGAEVDARPEFAKGKTALMVAAITDQSETARFLLRMGSDIKILNDCGQSALMLAEFHDSIRTKNLLINKYPQDQMSKRYINFKRSLDDWKPGYNLYTMPNDIFKPAIYKDECILVDFDYYSSNNPKQGDIVVFIFPKNIKKDFVMRIVALEGETIELKDNILYIDNKKVSEDYVTLINKSKNPKRNFGPFTVPQSHYFVMGDQRDRSHDSRFWGPIARSAIKGKVLKIHCSKTIDRIGITVK